MIRKKAFTPEEILPAGVDYAMAVNPFTGLTGKIRKATVAASLNNIALLNKLLVEDTELDQIRRIDKAISKLIPSLKVVGVFDLFSLDEWASNDLQLGRIYIVLIYLKQYPEEMTDRLASILKKIKKNTKSRSLRSKLDTILK
ncbi:MAG TPA: hypothetical protein VLG76_06115 [Rhabdochlamydiaceae bacterium]|nr:hypothetical protein [Rhabdochlamydiaceae bacterium]